MREPVMTTSSYLMQMMHPPVLVMKNAARGKVARLLNQNIE